MLPPETTGGVHRASREEKEIVTDPDPTAQKTADQIQTVTVVATRAHNAVHRIDKKRIVIPVGVVMTTNLARAAGTRLMAGMKPEKVILSDGIADVDAVIVDEMIAEEVGMTEDAMTEDAMTEDVTTEDATTGAVMTGVATTVAAMTGAATTVAVMTGAVMTGAATTEAVTTVAVMTGAVTTGAAMTEDVTTGAVMTVDATTREAEANVAGVVMTADGVATIEVETTTGAVTIVDAGVEVGTIRTNVGAIEMIVDATETVIVIATVIVRPERSAVSTYMRISLSTCRSTIPTVPNSKG